MPAEQAVDARSADAEPARDCRRTKSLVPAQTQDFDGVD
jgi:hypothetical protein